jgi:phage repressor protein C with HTH and peptisase S24 domain
MQPKYHHGDCMVVDGGRAVQEGEACVVYRAETGERLARLKVLSQRGRRLRLESLNPTYKPFDLDRAAFIGAFPVIDHLPAVRQKR